MRKKTPKVMDETQPTAPPPAGAPPTPPSDKQDPTPAQVEGDGKGQLPSSNDTPAVEGERNNNDGNNVDEEDDYCDDDFDFEEDGDDDDFVDDGDSLLPSGPQGQRQQHQENSFFRPVWSMSIFSWISLSSNTTDTSTGTNNIYRNVRRPLRLTTLAFSRTTPYLARFLLPICCLLTHALFYYGQTAPMWKLRVFSHIDTWANATSNTARLAFAAAGVDYEQNIRFDEDEDVQTFTYYYAIEHLWKAKDLPGLFLPRLAAVLLIVFSGIWPHVKLLWLNLTWFFGKYPRRTGTLNWLSTLGKWSLADVLVVCVMVGVLHLDWVVDPAAIKTGVITDLPKILTIVKSQYNSKQVCNMLLKMDCDHQKNIIKKGKCEACGKFVRNVFRNPQWAQTTGKSILDGVNTSGGGLSTLRVVGMRGIYAFCGAVIISILLSLIVDIFDHRANQHMKKEEGHAYRRALDRQQQLRQQPPPQRLQEGEDEGRIQQDGDIVNDEADDNGGEQETSGFGRFLRQPSNEDTLREPLLSSPFDPLEVDLGYDDELHEQYANQTSPSSKTLFSWTYLLMTLVTAVVIFGAVEIPTMERQVHGAGPMLLSDILGVNWERQYSLRSLMWTTGAAGDWDYLLMATFGLFCVLGPVIRAVLLIIVSFLDRCCHVPSVVSSVATLVNFIGAFCSWEVFAIAIIMVQMLMPSITNTIVNNPVCKQISDDGSCLQVEFNILPKTFSTIIIGGIILIVLSLIAVNKGTDRGTTTSNDTIAGTTPALMMMMLMADDDDDNDNGNNNHTTSTSTNPNGYQRIVLTGEDIHFNDNDDDEDDDDEEEIVFETNQV